MSALPWICALQLGAVLCSFQGSEPMREGEPPARRGDAPSGLFTPRWLELRQTYGIERPQDGGVKFTSTGFLLSTGSPHAGENRGYT